MALYDVPAPAKLNLFLHVTGRRPDGYHELQTVFRYIDLCDVLDFDLRADGRIEREGDSGALPGLSAEDDLVVRAARALQKATGTRQGAQIRYTKRIPSGAGLGGGSSDAATTLIALNRLWDTGLSRAELMALARPLGADVPVFVFGRPAFGEGVGDVLTEVELPEAAYLVLRPQGGVPTASVFSSPDLTRNTEPVIISVFADWLHARAHGKTAEQQAALQQARQQWPTPQWSLRRQPLDSGGIPQDGVAGNELFGRNDLEPVVLAGYESIRNMAHALRKQGFRARMTGSGSCFFIEYDSLEQAARAQQEISSKMLDSGSEGCEHGSTRGPTCNGSTKAVVENSWACPGLFDHPLRHW